MTSITVQRTGFGIVVAKSDDAEAAAILDGLPPLRAARYLTATPALRDALRSADAEVVDAVLPHLDGAVVVPEAGLAKPGDDGEAESTRLAQALGVSVVAPEGRIVRCEGTLFSVGGGDGWIAQSPLGARVRAGRRYPAPAWQSQLPESLRGAAHIPAGVWITAGTEPRHAMRLAGIAVRERQLLVVAGSPSEPAPSEDRLLAVLRSLPMETRSAVVLAGFGAGSLPLETVRALAAALDQPLRVAHGVEIDGASVRIDGDEHAPPTTLALESVCAPDGTVTLERWAPPPGLVATNVVEYRLGETPTTRRRAGDRWVVHVVAAGIVVRPAGQPLVDETELEAPVGSLGIFVQCDGAQQPAALPALLAPLRERLAQRSAVTIHPLDGAARRVVRDAYPGAWAPTESLAITADGRIVAAAADASGDTDVAADDLDHRHAASEAAPRTAAEPALDEATLEAERHGTDGEVEQAHVERLEVSPAAIETAAAQPERTRAQRRGDVAGQRAAGQRAALRESTDAATAARDATTVDAVIGGVAAASAPEESAGAAQRRARDAQVTNVPSADSAAAAWYAAAVRRPTPTDAVDRVAHPADAQPAPKPASTLAPEPTAPTVPQTRSAAQAEAEAPSTAAATADASATPGRASAAAASDALARALQGSASTRLLGAGTRAATAAPRSASVPEPDAQPEPAAERAAGALQTATAPAPAAAEAAPVAEPSGAVAAADAPESPRTEEATAARAAEPPRRAPAIDVPLGVRSTADQRHRVRTALGPRYDVASRTVSQLLAQQPGMRVASDRSAMLTGLSLVRVFATEPQAEYDLDFHTCLAEGLAMLPTARSVVVRGIPAGLDAAPGSLLRLRTPLVAAAADGPAAGPAEALIWTTSGRRLDRVLHGSPGADDVVLPAGARLRVLGTAEGPAPRLLLAEESADPEQALARLHAAAATRGEIGAHADDRWFGDLPLAA